MNWDAIGAVGEILGATGVIVTLAYLATQIRQNTRQSRATAFQTLTDTGAAVSQMIVGDADVARIWHSAHAGKIEELSPEDWTRFQLALGAWLECMESVFMQRRMGGVDDELFDSRMEIVRALLASPAAKRVWKEIRFSFTESFGNYVEAELM